MKKLIALVVLMAVPAFGATGTELSADLKIMLGQTQAEGSRSWTDAQLLSIFNMAAKEVATLGGGREVIDTLAGGSVRLTGLDSNFIALKGTAWLWRSGKEYRTIPYKPLDSFHVLIAANDPQVQGRDRYIITEDGGGIAIFPAPPSTDSVLISYSAYPDVIVAGTEIQFTKGWEQVLLYAAASLAYQKLDDRFWVQFYVSERDKLIATLRSVTSRRPAANDAR